MLTHKQKSTALEFNLIMKHKDNIQFDHKTISSIFHVKLPNLPEKEIEEQNERINSYVFCMKEKDFHK